MPEKASGPCLEQDIVALMAHGSRPAPGFGGTGARVSRLVGRVDRQSLGGLKLASLVLTLAFLGSRLIQRYSLVLRSDRPHFDLCS